MGDSEGQVTVYQLRGLTAQNDNQVGGGGGGVVVTGEESKEGGRGIP